MQLAPCPRFLRVLIAFGCALQVRAEFSTTTLLNSGNGLNLETGSTGTTGIDLLWSGTGLSPRDGARVGKIPLTSARIFDAQDEATLRSFTIFATTATITAANLPVNTILVALSRSGNLSKLLVTAAGVLYWS